MPIDYSKWDKLELSDDSDIECHPNVDKRSMIKWKREAIHRERAERKARIAHLEQFTTQQQRLHEKVDGLIATLTNEPAREAMAQVIDALEKYKVDAAKLKQDQPQQQQQQQQQGPPMEEVFDRMIKQVRGDIDQAQGDDTQLGEIQKTFLGRLQATQATLDTVRQNALQELEKLRKEESRKITTENMFHETANRTVSGHL